jgi:hypothetical protein
MATISQLRAALATALANEGTWSTFDHVPASPTANSVIISPDDPYIEPQNTHQITVAAKANLKITIVVPLIDNEANLTLLESWMAMVLSKLDAATNLTITVGTFSAPTVAPQEMGSMLMTDLAISSQVTWS